MPAQTRAATQYETDCLANAVHFIACRGAKPSTRIKQRFDRIEDAEAFGAAFGDNRTMIYAVTALGQSAHIRNV